MGKIGKRGGIELKYLGEQERVLEHYINLEMKYLLQICENNQILNIVFKKELM